MSLDTSTVQCYFFIKYKVFLVIRPHSMLSYYGALHLKKSLREAKYFVEKVWLVILGGAAHRNIKKL